MNPVNRWLQRMHDEPGTFVAVLVMVSLLSAMLAGQARADEVLRSPWMPDPETGLIAVERPQGDTVQFADIQERCVQAGQVRFGPGQRWSDCRLMRARFVSTIGLLDFYHAQYCLIRSGNKCDRHALVVFANRAYKDDATLVLERFDAPGTIYADPLVTGSMLDNLLVLSARQPGQAFSREYRYWQQAAWRPVPGDAWKNLALAHFGVGTRIKGAVMPDAESMAVRVEVQEPGRRASSMQLQFGLRNGAPVLLGVAAAEPLAGGERVASASIRHVH